MIRKWIPTESGIFLLTRMRYARWLLSAVFAVAVVLAADVYWQQTNQPPAVFAQSCETPTISLYSGGAEFVNYAIKYTSDISEPESYGIPTEAHFRNRLVGHLDAIANHFVWGVFHCANRLDCFQLHPRAFATHTVLPARKSKVRRFI